MAQLPMPLPEVLNCGEHGSWVNATATGVGHCLCQPGWHGDGCLGDSMAHFYDVLNASLGTFAVLLLLKGVYEVVLRSQKSSAQSTWVLVLTMVSAVAGALSHVLFWRAKRSKRCGESDDAGIDPLWYGGIWTEAIFYCCSFSVHVYMLFYWVGVTSSLSRPLRTFLASMRRWLLLFLLFQIVMDVGTRLLLSLMGQDEGLYCVVVAVQYGTYGLFETVVSLTSCVLLHRLRRFVGLLSSTSFSSPAQLRSLKGYYNVVIVVTSIDFIFVVACLMEVVLTLTQVRQGAGMTWLHIVTTAVMISSRHVALFLSLAGTLWLVASNTGSEVTTAQLLPGQTDNFSSHTRTGTSMREDMNNWTHMETSIQNGHRTTPPPQPTTSKHAFDFPPEEKRRDSRQNKRVATPPKTDPAGARRSSRQSERRPRISINWVNVMEGGEQEHTNGDRTRTPDSQRESGALDMLLAQSLNSIGSLGGGALVGRVSVTGTGRDIGGGGGRTGDGRDSDVPGAPSLSPAPSNALGTLGSIVRTSLGNGFLGLRQGERNSQENPVRESVGLAVPSGDEDDDAAARRHGTTARRHIPAHSLPTHAPRTYSSRSFSPAVQVPTDGSTSATKSSG